MSERTYADRLAERLLNKPNNDNDSDDELRLLARQLLRRGEVIKRLEKRLVEMSDGTDEVKRANRDSILRITEEGLMRVRRLLDSDDANAKRLAIKTIEAVNAFHSMHSESWGGWPE